MKEPLLSSSFKYRQQDPDYRGQPLERQYADGPVQKRQCTDLLCCLLFLAFIAGMIYIAYIGFTTGDPRLLASPFDQAQNQCKIDFGFQQYDKIFITTFESNLSKVTFVCVKSCPTSNKSAITCHTNSIVSNCNLLVPYQSQAIVNVCLPKVGVNFDFESFGNIGILQQYFSDLRDGKYLVLAMFGVAFLVSILYSLLMRCFAGCFIWTIIIVFILFSLVIGVSILILPEVEFLQKIVDYDSLPSNLKDRDYQIGAGTLCLIIAFLTLLIVCCMKRQIKISIGIIKASADFVRNCFSSYSLPIIISILQMMFLSFWVAVMLFLFSSNNNIDPIENTPFAMIVWNQNIQRFTIYYVFGLIWMVMFLDGLGLYLVSSTVAIWYFEEGSPRSPIIRSICRSFKNFGSIVFGSLLLTIITVIRVVLEYVNNKAKRSTIAMGDQQAAAVSFALKCANCLVACFQRIIRFLTQNAYIMMAVSGKSFCSSAKQSFYLMLRSTAQFAISHGTTKIFINVGKAFIITICCVCGYTFITSIQPYKHDIYSPLFMTIIFAVVSFPIVYAFMELFEMAANTLLICYCIELDLVQRKSRCPNGLRNFLEQYVQSSSILHQQQNK